MIIQDDFKIEKAVTKEKMREAMLHVLLEGKCIVATDGHCMVIGKQDEDNGKRLLSVESLQYARKLAKKLSPIFDVTDTHEVHTNGVMFPKPKIEASKFPRWRKVIPRQKAAYTLFVSKTILNKVADALGSDWLAIEVITDAPAPVLRVFGNGKTDRFGIIMTRHGDNFNREYYFNETNIEADNENI